MGVAGFAGACPLRLGNRFADSLGTMPRMVRTALLTLWLLALSAPAALAYPGKDGGEGTWGLTNDRVVTAAGFLIIGGFPVLIMLLSMLQWKLEKRKDARLAAARARKARADVRGGW